MKKSKIVLTACLGILMMFNSAMVFAADSSTSESASNTRVLGQRSEQLQEKVQDQKSLAEQLKPYYDQVRANRTQILELRSQLISTRSQLTTKIAELKKEKDTLTEEQMIQLQDSIKALESDKTEMKSLVNGIHAQVLNLRVAKQEQDIEKAQTCLQSIIDIEKQRIDCLNKTISDMQKILTI